MDEKTLQAEYPDLHSAVSQMVGNTAGRISNLEQKTLADSQQSFLRDLTAAVPTWRTVCEEDPNWPVWLSGQHRYSNKTKLDLLKEAFQCLDSPPIINLLKSYLAEKVQAAPKAPPVAPPVEIITRSFITQFYQDVVHGKYRGREKEEQAIKAKIDKATGEGRVR